MAEDVGLVFQDFEAQLFSTNVELEVAFGPENFAVPRDEIATRIDENLSYVGLTSFRHRPPATLSGGQKQKLAIASVLALQPKVLVMDEPTTDLDPISKMGIYEITGRLRQRSDLTLLVVEHDTEEVLEADRIALLQDGHLIKVGPAREILQEVDLFESLGLMPLGIARFFKAMGAETLPLTPDEAVAAYRSAGWSISSECYEAILERERQLEREVSAREPLIHCRDLEFSYPGGVKALDGITLDIFKGDIMDESDVAVGFAKGLGAILMVVASVGGLIFGVLAAVGLAGQQMFGFAGESGKVAVWLVVLPFLVLLVIASFMLSGREQFEEVED